MKIGFIGVGNMGGPMCRNIIKNTNHQVMVHDLDPAAVARCTALGAASVDSIAGLAGCEVVFTSLAVPAIVEAVIAGPGGLAATGKPGMVVIDLSTNSPETAQAMAAALAAKGIAMLEAPVSGGVARAADGTIAVMVGGDAAVFAAQEPLFASFSSKAIHVGDFGMGSVAKLINNMLAFCNMAAAAEGLMMGAAAGIDLGKLAEVVSISSGASGSFTSLSSKAFAGNFAPGFALDLAHKDLRLAVQLADLTGVPGMVAPNVLNLLRAARGMGLGGEDVGAMIKVYEGLMGRAVRAP
ncbi:MAG: NAD(P)-dependent oxidoreductase [Acetobacteraceae bacterium]|nr:NAD(P)-dependent oxidoreductase [Acetobacteraceae bacterium]